MRELLLRHVYVVQLSLFVASAGLLTYFAQNEEWPSFWIVLVSSAVLFLANAHVTSAGFRSRTDSLIRLQNELAARFGHSGISRFFNMQDPDQQRERNIATQRILELGHTFSLCSLTAASYVDPAVGRHWEVLRSRLDAGCYLRLLLLDPFCVEKAARDERNEAGDAPDSKLRLEQLARLVVSYPNVEVRMSKLNIYGAVFSSEHAMTYDPYHLGKEVTRIENRFMCLAIDKQLDEVGRSRPGSYYAILQSHFEYLWSKGAPFEDFVRDNRRRIRQYAGARAADEIDGLLNV